MNKTAEFHSFFTALLTFTPKMVNALVWRQGCCTSSFGGCWFLILLFN